MTENDALVAAIQAERGAKKMTLNQLADRVGVSYSSMQRYLAGERIIDSDLMWVIAEALGVKVSYLWLDAERRLAEAEAGVIRHPSSGVERRQSERTVTLEHLSDEARSEFERAANRLGLSPDKRVVKSDDVNNG